jgi:hypothetical protein
MTWRCVPINYNRNVVYHNQIMISAESPFINKLILNHNQRLLNIVISINSIVDLKDNLAR